MNHQMLEWSNEHSSLVVAWFVSELAGKSMFASRCLRFGSRL